MKLIDFSQYQELNDLREEMNAPLKEWSAFKWEQLNAEDLLNKLRSSKGILLEEEDLQELIIDEEGLFVYKGQRVLVYIRDQFFNPNYPNREYKYHICSCETIDNMFTGGRKNRYVVTKNTSEQFWVREINRFTDQLRYEGDRQMNVCKNCLLYLKYDGYYDHRNSSNKNIYRNFSLEEFFEKYGTTKHTQLPDHDEKSAPSNQYSSNFSEISIQYRKSINWKCEQCGLDLTSNKRLLHVHHINSIRSDNDYSNLMALCVGCHAEKPGHEDLKKTPDYSRYQELFG